MQKSLQKWKECFKWQFEAYPFFTSVYNNVAKPTNKKYYIDWRGCFLNHFSDGQLTAFRIKSSLLVPGRKTIKELLAGNNSFLKEFKKIDREMNKAIMICLKARVGNNYKNFETWWPSAQQASTNAPRILFSFDYALDEFLEKINNNKPNDYGVLKNYIITDAPSFINEANERLLNLNNFNKR